MARYAIWYHLYNWKNVKNSLRGPKACNFTKSNIDPWVFFIFFKLHKWYQIAQRISYIWDQLSIEFLDFFCFFFFFLVLEINSREREHIQTVFSIVLEFSNFDKILSTRYTDSWKTWKVRGEIIFPPLNKGRPRENNQHRHQ